MSYLRYLCLFVHSDVQHIYCVVVLFSFSLRIPKGQSKKDDQEKLAAGYTR
jgi:hypothetical protein